MKNIIYEYRGHCGYMYIFPVRNINMNSADITYEKKDNCIMGIYGFDINHVLLESLNKHIDPDIQFMGNIRGDNPAYFEPNGWNFYTKEAVMHIVGEIRNVLINYKKESELKRLISSEEIEFCKNISDKLEKMVEVSSDYEYILFMGP